MPAPQPLGLRAPRWHVAASTHDRTFTLDIHALSLILPPNTHTHHSTIPLKPTKHILPRIPSAAHSSHHPLTTLPPPPTPLKPTANFKHKRRHLAETLEAPHATATMQKAMQGKDFKMIRRNSLTAEVDGVWPNLEEEEDSYTPHKVMMKGKCLGKEGQAEGRKK